MPVVSPLAIGLNACVTARPEMRSASDCSTVSNCLPPVVACVKARVMALAKPLALTARLAVCALSPLRTLPRPAPAVAASLTLVSRMLSAIGIPRHHVGKRGAVERRATPARCFDRAGQFARRHAPELVGREPQHAKSKADRLLPGKGIHRRGHIIYLRSSSA